jgi:hypothetical protein
MVKTILDSKTNKNIKEKNKQNKNSILKGSRHKKFKKIIKKRFRASTHKRFLLNPSITHFNLESQFIYDVDEVKTFLSKNQNGKLLLVNANELERLKEKINYIKLQKNIDIKTEYIKIPKNIFSNLEKYLQIKDDEDPLTQYIKAKFESSDDRTKLSCRKIAESYFLDTGKKTNRTSVLKIIKEKLGYKFLKTNPKSFFITDNEHILVSLAFIKIIVRCILLNFNILFCDETSILNKNNHLRVWRKSEETIYHNYDSYKKKNIIMTVSSNEVIYYSISDESTNSDVFLEYMKKLKKVIDEKSIKQYVLLLDNLSSHKSPLLIKFFSENKINVIFNSPRMSSFNCIELAFRTIKNILYKKLFFSIDEMEKQIVEIINDEQFKKTLLYNYCETLLQYTNFIEANKHFDFNSI